MERTVAIEQERDLFEPITERREVKLAATEALIQIAAQPPRVDGGAEIGVRGGDDGHVHARPLARIGAERTHSAADGVALSRAAERLGKKVLGETEELARWVAVEHGNIERQATNVANSPVATVSADKTQ